MNITTALLSAVVGILTCGNFIQFFQLRQIRQKATAEVDASRIENLNKVIDAQTEEIARLQKRVCDAEDRYNDLYEKYNSLRELINSKL